MADSQPSEEIMIIRRLFILAFAIAGCAAAATAIGRHTRHLDKQQHKKDLRTWEHEGGNLASSEIPAATRPAAAA